MTLHKSLEKLTKMGEAIEKIKQTRAEHIGARSQCQEQLESEFELESVEDAADELESLEEKIDTVTKEIVKGVAKIEKDYAFLLEERD